MEKSLTIKPARSYFETRKRLCFHFENKFVAIGIYEKQILDYILWLTLKSNIEHQTSELGVRNTINYKKRSTDFDTNNYSTVLLYANDFLKLTRNRRPSGDEYKKFYEAIDKLKITYVCWDNVPEIVSGGRGIIDERQQCIFDSLSPIKDNRGKVIGYQIKISKMLARELQWVSNNYKYRVDVANLLNTKYSYDLYTYLVLKVFFFNGKCNGQSTELQKALNFAEWDRTTRQQVTRAAKKISESYKKALGREIIINMECIGNLVTFSSPQIAAQKKEKSQQKKNKAQIIEQKEKQVAAIKQYDPYYPKTGSIYVDEDDADDSEEWCF